MSRHRTDLALALAAALAAAPSLARADDDAQAAQAKAEFVHGTELVRDAQWAEALAAFERASKARPHAVTSYNVGVCQRALGQYVRARATFGEALAQDDASGKAQLSVALRDDTLALVRDIDALLATLSVSVEPASASVTIDGRPLAADAREPTLLVAGVRAPGAGEPPPAPKFRVRVDPGAHVIAFSRKGYNDAVFSRVLAPGSSAELSVHLDDLPATLHIASQPAGAIVMVGGADIGLSPVDLARPAGTYTVLVKKVGFVPYETQVTAHAGEELSVRPSLPVEKRSVVQTWWFWSIVGVVVTGAVVGTAVGVSASQPKTRAPVFTGGLGWSAPIQ